MQNNDQIPAFSHVKFFFNAERMYRDVPEMQIVFKGILELTKKEECANA